MWRIRIAFVIKTGIGHYNRCAMKAFSIALFALILLTPPRGKATDERQSKDEIDRRSAEATELFERGHTPESKKIFESLFSSRVLSMRCSRSVATVINKDDDGE